jgi:phosphomannomutase/phosphoglucomutase
MKLLARYAQATFSAEQESHAHENHAGMGQVMVGEREPEVVQAREPLAEERLPLSIFRAGVIRGRSGMDLDEEVVQAIGLAVGSVVREKGEKQVVVGRDNRATSDAYASALVAGLLASGCDVTDMGEVPAPVLNYALFNSGTTSGVMVTGGHNPPEYNGFKIYVEGQPFAGHDYLELRQRILEGRFEKGVGNLNSHDFAPEYVRHVTGEVQLVEPLKLVLDCGNGVAGPVARRLFEELGCEVISLFCEPDGGFPNHIADPADERNLQALILEVQAQGAALGIALDVDGDALALVDEKGKVVPADHLLMLLAADIIRRNPGADVLYDVACSAMLPEYILSNGGRPIMWRTGHAELQSKLKENGGLLAGEMSGHLYINDRWYGFDDGLYVAARLLELFSLDSSPVSTAFEAFSSELVATPLLTLDLPEGKAEKIISRISREGDFGEADVIDLDGLRLEYEQAWGLIRSSNTRPALVFRFEARGEEAMEEIKARFRQFLERAAPELQPPF